jgi:hypothetical protein
MIQNYSEHKPQMLIYNNREVVSDGTADRNSACLVGVCRPSFTTKNFLAQMVPVTELTVAELGEEEESITLPLSNFTPVSDFLQQFVDTNQIQYVDANESPVAHTWITASKGTNGVISLTITKLGEEETRPDVYISLPKLAFKVNFNNASNPISIQEINSPSDITTYLGLVDSDPSADDFNSLAFAATLGYTAGEGNGFYVDAIDWTFQTLDSDQAAAELAAYNASFNKLSRTDLFMNLWCDTDTLSVLNSAKSYVIQASQPDVQRWRGLYASTDTTDDQGAEAISRSTNWAYNGVVNVWSPGAYYLMTADDGTTKEVPLANKYIAAGIACMRANLLPQQGMSRMEISWISSVPAAYASWTDTQLNNVAANGVWIIAQDDDRTVPYVRHQLTTDSSHGVLYYEDNIRDIVYNVNYGVKDLFRDYPGRRNITRSLLQELENRLGDYLLSLTQEGSSVEERRIGPMIVDVDLDSITAVRDSQFADRVNLSGDYYVATSLNVLKISLNTYLGL